MKRLLLAIFALSLLSTIEASAQSFASLDGTWFKTEGKYPGFGLDFTGGAIIKNRNDKGARTFMLGAGIGAYAFNESDIYIPLFATFGYFNKSKKITPYINGRIGYGFYKGSANFIGKTGTVKGGLYANIRGGAGFRVTKRFFPTPFVGCSLMILRKFVVGQDVTQYNSGLLNAGVSLMF